MRNYSKLIVWVGLCCTWACGNKQLNLASKYVKSQAITASQGGTVSVTSSDDPSLAGTSIQIPPKALSQDTTITLTVGNALTLVGGDQAAGPVVDFGPDGTTFQYPPTVTLPVSIPSGRSDSELIVVGVESDGTTLVVGREDLTYDANKKTASFAVAGFTRFGVLVGVPPCPTGTALCGCGGGGRCLDGRVVCPDICPGTSGGSGTNGTQGNTGSNGTTGGSGSTGTTGTSGGGSCCPAGEYFCGCGNVGQCIPADQACMLECPLETDPPTPACCPSGEYFCGCNGQGSCVPDTQACVLNCPINTTGTTGGTNGGTNSTTGTTGQTGSTGTNGCPSGETQCCDGQCVPSGSACPQVCPEPDGGPMTCPTGETICCNQCIPQGEACPALCPSTNGTTGTTGSNGSTGATGSSGSTGCSAGETQCCDGSCVPSGLACPQVCPEPDAGSVCPAGEYLCCNQCLPGGVACNILCAASDAGP